jgi:adenosine deaminase
VKSLLCLLVLVIHYAFAVEPLVEFQRVPKAELHLHLSGSFPKDYLDSIATAKQQEELKTALDLIAEGVDYNAVFAVFQLIAEIVDTEEKLQLGVERLCLALQEDHVEYVEIRTGLRDLGHGCEEALKAVLAGIKASTSPQFKANVILSLRRNSSLKTARETIDLALKYRAQGVVGIDISGHSKVGEIESLIPELLRAKAAGIPFVVHMGEQPDEPDQMLILTTLEPKRIGHGVYLCPDAKEWVLNHQTPIEVSLTSSVLVKMIGHDLHHPGFEFFRLNHPIVFCTDDPLLFSTTVSKELLRAHERCNLSALEIKKIAQRSFEYALR